MADITVPVVRIPLSKTKLWFALVGVIVFVGLSGWYLIAPPAVRFGFVRDPLLVRLVGVVGLLFFGGVGIFIVIKLSDTRSGLEITDKGVMDNSSGVSAGLVRWTDVTAINETNIFGQRFLLLVVRNPDEYINRQTSALKRRGMTMNYKQIGTPISLGANALQVSFVELKALVTQRFLAFQASEIGRQTAQSE